MAVVFSVPAWAFSENSTLLDVQAVFASEVGGVEIDSDYRQQVARQAGSLIRDNQAKFDESQFFLLVDRNHGVQKAFLAFYDAEDGKVLILGADNASTGNPKRRGYFETPVGVFENKPSNMSYRALGTKNKLGWRGFGVRGSRVWDLGWQRTVKNRGEPMDIRMLVHATDPDQGEKRLGTVQSKGCIRVSWRFNKFLDQYGILDRMYEESAKAQYVLPLTRDPIPLAGKFVVVIDSGVSEQPAA
ncbi:MAG: murein L,D-transpeptidase [Minisyncoccia bacterium]